MNSPPSSQTWLVTGGAGFIGSNFVLEHRAGRGARIVNLDKLTYAGNLESLAPVQHDPEHIFVQGDIGDRALVSRLLAQHRPAAVVNFAAETHVDRSISGPAPFLETNVVGVCSLLDAALEYWRGLPAPAREQFRFLHVSTDEVYGSLEPHDPPFTERSPHAPNSPYAASKAAADHFVRAYHRTYGLPALVTNAANTYGPRQYPEKLVPLTIVNALEGRPLPIYGDGLHVRDWVYVSDHCEAIALVLARGTLGETYNIGGLSECANLELVRMICAALDQARPDSPHRPHAGLIRHVADRPGHDRRYATDIAKIRDRLGWSPRETLASGIAKTVRWYLDHSAWVEGARRGSYQEWMRQNYAQRLERAR